MKTLPGEAVHLSFEFICVTCPARIAAALSPYLAKITLPCERDRIKQMNGMLGYIIKYSSLQSGSHQWFHHMLAFSFDHRLLRLA